MAAKYHLWLWCSLLLARPAACWGACGDECVELPGVSPFLSSEKEGISEIQCLLSCIQQYDIAVQVNDKYPSWPSVQLSQLESNCRQYQKVQECHSGCTVHSRAPSLTVNRCRDTCYSSCHDDMCQGQRSCSQPGSSCERNCRKTYCRTGCALNATTADREPAQLPSPIASPTLDPVTSQPQQFHCNVSSAMPSSEHQSTVGYLFRVTALNASSVGYVVKNNLEEPLDLSTFACQYISISFRVVSAQGFSSYSPPTELCVVGANGVPGQVEASTINVQYSENIDSLGHAMATINWKQPPGLEHLSSYDLTLTVETDTCGRHNQYHFSNIRSNATEFVIEGRYLKFGCSYTLTILSQPALQGVTGTHISIAPSLPSDHPPQLDLSCTREWNPQGYFSIIATWSVTPSPLMLDAIKRFTILSSLRDTTKWGIFAIVQRFPTKTVLSEDGLYQYSLILNNFTPQQNPDLIYHVEVRTDVKEDLFWRAVPPTQSCTVLAGPISPLPVTNVTIGYSEVTTMDLHTSVHLLLHWQPPRAVYGELAHYELRIVEADGHENATQNLLQETLPTPKTSVTIDATFILMEDIHCLYVQVRAYNEFMYSEWSSPAIVAVDGDCMFLPLSNGTYNSSSNNSCDQITIYVEKESGLVKVLEVECGQVQEGTGITAQLQELVERLESVEQTQSINQDRASSLQQRLSNIEKKLNALEQLLDSRS